jgi:hypothetical protein
MTTKKTFNTPSSIKAEARKKNPPLLFHDDGGNVVGHIDPPILWNDEIASVAERGTELEVMRTLLGDEYEAVKAAGWTPSMIAQDFLAWQESMKVT